MIKLKNFSLDDEKKPAIIFLAIAAALFIAFIGFFAWHTSTMRKYELSYVRWEGTVVDVEARHSTNSDHAPHTYYYLVISYTYDGQEYTFTDRTGHKYIEQGTIGSTTEIYVNPKNPHQAEKVSSSDFISIICACFFAFFCVTYTAGINILLSVKGSNFKKRLLFAWGTEILLGIAFLLLFWLGLPNSSFGEVFARIEGAVGVTVITSAVSLIALLDGIISCKRHFKNR